MIKTEEKGSDVNLATRLVSDAHERACDAAVLVTNDSDLAYPVELATFYKQIRAGVLADSQLPVKPQDDRGVIHRPARWA